MCIQKSVSTSLVLLLLTLTYTTTYADDYKEAFYEIYFGRHPNAKAEALGRSGVSAFTGVFGSFYNPALIHNSKGLIISGSYSSPYYLLDDANYDYFGLMLNREELGSISLNRFHFNYGEDYNYETYTSLITFSYANEFFWNMILGINVNFLKHVNKIAQTNFKMDSNPIDIGILKSIKLDNQGRVNQQIMFGASVFNINSAKIGSVESQEDALPIIFRTGTTYLFTYLNRTNSLNVIPMKFTLTTEYQDLFNAKKHTAFKFGTEIMFYEIIAIRLGYYNESRENYGYNENVSELRESTYGMGLQIPFNKISNYKIPFDLIFDFTSLKQPSYTKSYDNWDNFNVYSLYINWYL